MKNYVFSILLLAASSMIMTVAWYAHLKFKGLPLFWVILGSWGIAFFEYLLQVPANRIGHSVMPAAALRVIAEFFTLTAFMIFSLWYLKEPLSGNYLVSFFLILLAVLIAFFGPFQKSLL